MIKRALAAWVLLAVLMVLNGVVRELVYGASIGAYPAHVVSTVSGIVLLFIVAYFFVRGEKLLEDRDAWTVGVVWLAATIAFEFGFGFAWGRQSAELLAQYDVRTGHVWPAFLVAELLAPAFWVQHFRSKTQRPDPRVHFPLIRFE